jgi:hypothetical protein
MGVFRDITESGLMARDGDLEARVCCAPTLKKKGSNPRGCNTEHNLPLGAQVVAEGVVMVGLASASRPMKEKDLPCFGSNSRRDLLKGSTLIRIKVGNMFSCSLSLVVKVV